MLAARIVARYGKGKHALDVSVVVTRPKQDEKQDLRVAPMGADELPREWIL
jgi:hypothetical protein